jgi:hypothetical protein
LSEIYIAINEQGEFDQTIDLTDLESGEHHLIIKASDRFSQETTVHQKVFYTGF